MGVQCLLSATVMQMRNDEGVEWSSGRRDSVDKKDAEAFLKKKDKLVLGSLQIRFCRIFFWLFAYTNETRKLGTHFLEAKLF